MDLVADTARQALEHQALRTESRTDALTGVGNRRALDEELRQLLRFGPLPLALILVDVDHFKEINDRFTHVVADEVLRRVAASLSLQLRTDDQLLRYGGDEFVVLLPGTGDEEANAVAERMRVAVDARPWNELADGLEVSISTGCAAVWSLSGRRPDADAEKLFRRADERLLAAKRERPGDHEVRSLIGPASPGWGDESTDDVAAVSMPPTPSRTLGAEVLGPHSRPGSPHPAPQVLNGGRRSSDPHFDADQDAATPTGTPVNGTPVNGTPVNGVHLNGTPVNGIDLRLPPPGDPGLTDAPADREITKGPASSEISRFAGTDSGSNSATPPPAGSRRSRRAARDAEAHSPMNGISVEKQQAEAAAEAVAARQAADARERRAREEAEKAELEAQRREKEERERIEAEARRLAEQMDRERREAEARAEAERRERERQAAFARAEAERLEAERVERERIERERERAERERIEAERVERERVEAERRERERRRLEAERRERVEAERREAEARAKAEAERLERERLERERKEAEARAKAEAERLERERLERERKEAEARAKAEAERLERERLERERKEAEARAKAEAEARAKAERLAAEKAEKERLEKERQAALAKAEAERLEKQRAERERRIHEARERAAAARREREARERAEREEAEKVAREQAAREESERHRLEEVRRAAEEIRREAYERAAKLAASASTSSSTWPTAQGPHTGGWMMPSAAALESPTTPSAPIPDSLAPPNDPSRSEPNRRERRPAAAPSESDRRFQETAAQIYRPDPNLGPSTETIRALSDPLNDPLPGQSHSSAPSAGDSYSGSSYGSGPDYPSSGSYSGGYSGSGAYPNGSQSALPALPAAPAPPPPAAPSPYSNTPDESQAPWRPSAADPWGAGPRKGTGWSEDDEIDVRDDQGQLPGTGNRDQSGPSTSRQAIIDLSARRRHRSPND
nr:diguanylate cyclase [Kineosporia mesophila]